MEKDYAAVSKKYILFVRPNMYGKYIYDELSVSCYWTDRFVEGKKYLEKIINEPDFANHRERFNINLEHFTDKLKGISPFDLAEPNVSRSETEPLRKGDIPFWTP